MSALVVGASQCRWLHQYLDEEVFECRFQSGTPVQHVPARVNLHDIISEFEVILSSYQYAEYSIACTEIAIIYRYMYGKLGLLIHDIANKK
jgi:hypothetical protein